MTEVDATGACATRLRNLWIGPTGWVHSALAVAVTLGFLHADSFPVRISVPCWIAAALPLAGVYVFRAISKWRNRSKVTASTRGRKRASLWAVMPVCLLIMVASLATRWPFQVRLALSREALETEARRLLSVSPAEADVQLREGWARFFLDRKAGMYTIQAADVDYDRRHVYLSIGSVVRMSGLVFLGDSAEPSYHGYRAPYLPSGWELFAYP